MSEILSGRAVVFTAPFPMATPASDPSPHKGAVASGISGDGTALPAPV
jgi:hypothetical protein